MIHKALLLERGIRRFNEQLNKYDYGIVVDGKAYTDDIDFSKYTIQMHLSNINVVHAGIM